MVINIAFLQLRRYVHYLQYREHVEGEIHLLHRSGQLDHGFKAELGVVRREKSLYTS